MTRPFGKTLDGDEGVRPPRFPARGSALSVSDDGLPNQRPLRIVHAGPFMIGGGAERAFLDVARFFAPDRVEVVRSIVVNPDRVDPAVADEAPFPVEVGGRESIRRAAQECDVLLCWGLPIDEWLGANAGDADGAGANRPPRPPLVVFVAQGETYWTREMLEGSARSVDHVIAVSRRVQERVCGGFPSTVIYNGVDAARLAQTRSRGDVRRKLGFRPRDFVLGYVGRFADEKRPDWLVETIARSPPEFKALFVGWGYREAELVHLANARIPGRFALAKASEYLGDYYQAMDALCLLSEHEGCPMVVLEAMLCERPVIAMPVGSVPEMIEDRVNGIIVPGTPASVAAAAELLRRHPAWAKAVAREGKHFAERHGHARQTSRQYEQLLLGLWGKKVSCEA